MQIYVTTDNLTERHNRITTYARFLVGSVLVHLSEHVPHVAVHVCPHDENEGPDGSFTCTMDADTSVPGVTARGTHTASSLDAAIDGAGTRLLLAIERVPLYRNAAGSAADSNEPLGLELEPDPARYLRTR